MADWPVPQNINNDDVTGVTQPTTKSTTHPPHPFRGAVPAVTDEQGGEGLTRLLPATPYFSSEVPGANKAGTARWTITPPGPQDEKDADSDPPDPPDPPFAAQGPFSAGDPLTRLNPPGGSQAGQGGEQAGQGGEHRPAAEKASDLRKAGKAGKADHDPGLSLGTPCCETGGPLDLQCQLCSKSPTFWRRTKGDEQ